MVSCFVHSDFTPINLCNSFPTSLTLIIGNFDANYPLEAPQPHVPGNKPHVPGQENSLFHQISSKISHSNWPHHTSLIWFSPDISLARPT